MTKAKPSWTATADLMRQHGIVHATWDDKGNLLSMTIGPREVPQLEVMRPTAPVAPPKPVSIAQRMAQQHEIRFAHSRMRPALDAPKPADPAEPRAVRAKREAHDGGSEAG